MRLIFYLFLLLFISCQPASYEGFRSEGRVATRELIADLKKVRTKDQLVQAEDRLKKRLTRLRELVERVESYRTANIDGDIPDLEPIDHELSDALKLELTRVMRLEGGQAILKGALSNQ